MARNEKKWHLRLRIFDSGNHYHADTHPDLGVDEYVDDSELCDGLPGTLERVSTLLHQFHNLPQDTMEGARMRDLVKRVPTIRVYMSQHSGRCTIKIPYTPEGSTAWSALAVIQRPDWQGWDAQKEAERAARPSLRVAK